MKKDQLIHQLAEAVDLPKKKMEEILVALVATIYQETQNGGQVKLPKLGTFHGKKRNARLVYNPTNSLTYVIQEGLLPVFIPTQVYKDYLAKKPL